MYLTYSVLSRVYRDGSKHSPTYLYSTGSGAIHDPVRGSLKKSPSKNFG